MWWKKNKPIELDIVQQRQHEVFQQTLKYFRRRIDQFDITSDECFPVKTEWSNDWYLFTCVTEWEGSGRYGRKPKKYISIETSCHSKDYRVVNKLKDGPYSMIYLHKLPKSCIKQCRKQEKEVSIYAQKKYKKHSKYWKEQRLIKENQATINTCNDVLNDIIDPIHEIVLKGDQDG